MTIKELKKLIKNMPADMDVLIPQGDLLVTACKLKSDVIEIETEDDIVEVFLLCPCDCNQEVEPNLFPDLN